MGIFMNKYLALNKLLWVVIPLSILILVPTYQYTSELPYIKVGIRKIRDKSQNIMNSTAEYTIVLQSAEQGDSEALFTSQVRKDDFATEIQKYLFFDGKKGFKFSTEKQEYNGDHKSLEELKKLVDDFDQAVTDSTGTITRPARSFNGIKNSMAQHSHITKIDINSTPSQVKEALKNALDDFEKHVFKLFIDNCGSDREGDKSKVFFRNITPELKRYSSDIVAKGTALKDYFTQNVLTKLTPQQQAQVGPSFNQNLANLLLGVKNFADYVTTNNQYITQTGIEINNADFSYTPRLDLSKISDYTKPYRQLYREIQRLGSFFGFTFVGTTIDADFSFGRSLTWLGIIAGGSLGLYLLSRVLSSPSATLPKQSTVGTPAAENPISVDTAATTVPAIQPTGSPALQPAVTPPSNTGLNIGPFNIFKRNPPVTP